MGSLFPPHAGRPLPPPLVVTLGPASVSSAAAMLDAGATALRLNASHLDASSLRATLAGIRWTCGDVPIVVDLQGAKMRLDVEEPRAVATGEAIELRPLGDTGITVPHPELFTQVSPGDTLSIDDGRIRLDVIAASGDLIEARALNAGVLRPRKGVNVEQHPVTLAGLTARDRAACDVATAEGVSAFAFSFMHDGREAAWLRALLPACTVVGKVERREAVTNLASIAAAVDEVWICRGDLGAQLGLAEMARAVASVDPAAVRVPVLMAGQVFEHLTSHDEPTRSEVCHLHDLLARGFAGIVLSDETAIGRSPVHAVSVAASLLAALRR
jgi:pyruvate kinase